jgi:arsenical resistance operon trans-acting repressor ArsD
MNVLEGTSPVENAVAARVELFDPPMCCPTGLCGPTLDQTLLDVNEMVAALNSEGIGVERYQMASHPHVFLKHPDVMRLVRERGMDAFPVTVIGGRVVKTGQYPSRGEIDAALAATEGQSK